MTTESPSGSPRSHPAPSRAEPVAPPRGPGLARLHHVATVGRDISRAIDFYGRILGLRDLGSGSAPSLAGGAGEVAERSARWFAAGAGDSGLVAVLERPDARSGYPGIGSTHHFALCVEDRDTLLMWKRRFLDEGYAVNGILDRHYFQSIYVKDPDGTIVELATRGPGWAIDEPADRIGEEHRAPPEEMVNTNRDRARIAAENWPDAVPTITPRMAIQGMHHVTAIGTSIEVTHAFLADRLGMRRVKRTNNFDDVNSFHWYWGVGEGKPGTLVTYFERSFTRERAAEMGAGQVEHYALTAEPESIDPLSDALARSGRPVSVLGEFGADDARFRALATVDPDGQPVLMVVGSEAASEVSP
jgi:glyoxalase family protein